MERWRRHIVVAVMVAVAAALMWLTADPVKTSVVAETRSESVPYAVERVPTAELPLGAEAVIDEGKVGHRLAYTYFEERRFLGRILSRAEVPAGDRPTHRVESEPETRTVEYGTATDFTSDLEGTAEAGVELGKIGPGGVMLVRATGTVQYMKGAVSGPAGDPSHDYTFVPLRTDVNVGALLVRVGDNGPWIAYTELPVEGDMRVVSGNPGEPVRAVVNDAPGLFEDNIGRLSIATRLR